jgi:hypothetical protein
LRFVWRIRSLFNAASDKKRRKSGEKNANLHFSDH